MTDDAEATSSPVVATVHDHLLNAITDGVLNPGDRISDADIAQEFGVSRTPVREAIQRLRDIGVIEASANRYTRVAIVTPEQTRKAMIVWVALYRVLVEEVVPSVPDHVVDAMAADHQHFVDLLPVGDFPRLAKANFDFYAHMTELSSNEVLTRAITGVVHMIRLGSLHLPEAIDVTKLAHWQQALVEAARAHDVSAATKAIDALRRLRIPEG